MKDMLKSTFVLVITAVIAASLLAVVYQKTSPEIEKRAKEKLIENLKKVFPVTGAEAEIQVEKAIKKGVAVKPVAGIEYEPVIQDTVWLVKKDGETVGLIFVNGKRGYSSIVKVIVGVDTTGKIVGILIPKEGLSETPGLGMKVTEPWFMEQFVGKKMEEIKLKKDGGTLDAITAATISSRAATEAVREGMEKYLPLLKKEKIKSWYESHLNDFFPGAKVLKVQDGLWKAVKGDETLGTIYLSSAEGYGGEVGVLVAVKDGVIEGIYVQSPEEGLKETSGIGTKVRESEFLSRFKGKRIEEINGIDCISGATVSSSAVKKAVIDGYSRIGGGK